jgi:hypothetical protein
MESMFLLNNNLIVIGHVGVYDAFNRELSVTALLGLKAESHFHYKLNLDGGLL